MLLESRFQKVLDKMDHGLNPLRNRRILELSLGLDGSGSKTNKEVQEVIDAEFPSEKVTQERIRVLCKSSQSQFASILASEWKKDCFFNDLCSFIDDQLPIELNLLNKRLADPSYKSFNRNSTNTSTPFSEHDFKVDGLLKVLKLMPKSAFNSQYVIKLVYCGIARQKNKDFKFSSRNTAPSIRFVTRKNDRLDLDALVSHAERSIKFNGMIAEHSLVPLMTKSLPLFKREELAHSIVHSHLDFKQLDEKLGYFTFINENSLNNRISKIARKIFEFTDKIHIDLFAKQVSKASCAPARQLKGESDDPNYQNRADVFQTFAYSSENHFTTRDAEMYFVGAGLCEIDEEKFLTPTDLLLDAVEPVIRWSEQVSKNVLDRVPTKSMTPGEFRESMINEMVEQSMEYYEKAIFTLIARGVLYDTGNQFVMTPLGIEIFSKHERDALNRDRNQLLHERSKTYENSIELASILKDKSEHIKIKLREVKAELKEKKTKKLHSEIGELENTIQNLMLLKAEYSEFSNRKESLKDAIKRIEKQKTLALDRFGSDSIRYQSECERLEIAKSHLDFIEFLETDENVVKACDDVVVSNDLKEIRDRIMHYLDIEPSDIKGMLIQNRFLEFKFDYIDYDLSQFPAPNDKYDTLVVNVFHELCQQMENEAHGYVLVADKRKVWEEVKIASKEDEIQCAQSQHSQVISYSPLVYRKQDNTYTYIGEHQITES